MTDPMTPAERATAYEVEAAQMIDRTIRKLPEGVTTAASLKLVELIVQAAVERMSAVTNIAVNPPYVTDGKTVKPAVNLSDDDLRALAAERAEFGSTCAAAFRCTLAPNHDGLHKFEPE